MKIKEEYKKAGRSNNQGICNADLVVVGGGLSGVCAAISASREGLQTILVQDRPVLGGNASSEVRLWILGATSHMGNNNRWARESGIMGEILIENMNRNKEGNPLIFDTVLLEKVIAEEKILLLLNTSVHAVRKADENIVAVEAFCSQNSTTYRLEAPFFCDASGDGIVAFLAGAAFRMGAEKKEEFDEGFAPAEEYGELLGHSMYFYSKDVGYPVHYHPPSFASKNIEKIIKYRSFSLEDQGCRYWWLEYGGRLDTIHETETIKWELWKVIYGVWDYIKNSGKFPESANHTLEWVGTIPGKRESRRFEGDYMMSQKDIIEQRVHEDAISYGGWAVDLHPADGVFSERAGCNQWHSKGIYQIPLRSIYSKNIDNLWFAGRIISASHVAFGSTRVMATCGYTAQVLGPATRMCITEKIVPRDLIDQDRMSRLQKYLLRNGQFIPRIFPKDPENLATRANIVSSSELILKGLPPTGPWISLDFSFCQMLPLEQSESFELEFITFVEEDTKMEIQLRKSVKADNFTPEILIQSKNIKVKKGEFYQKILFDIHVEEPQYFYIILVKNDKVKVRTSEMRISGILSLMNKYNKSVATSSVQSPPNDIGIDTFEFWCPQRRPEGRNLAFKMNKGLRAFKKEFVINGIARPVQRTNVWCADPEDKNPFIMLKWDSLQWITSCILTFDADYDNAMESSLMHHPENVMPFCVRDFSIEDDEGRIIYEQKGNYHSRVEIQLQKKIQTKSIRINMKHPSKMVPASLFDIKIYE
jgi:hypothetical protein